MSQLFQQLNPEAGLSANGDFENYLVTEPYVTLSVVIYGTFTADVNLELSMDPTGNVFIPSGPTVQNVSDIIAIYNQPTKFIKVRVTNYVTGTVLCHILGSDQRSS